MKALRLVLVALCVGACGVKAPPRPPGVPAAKRGEPEPPCPGCAIPSPDSLPSPSVPLRDYEEGPAERRLLEEVGVTPTVEPTDEEREAEDEVEEDDASPGGPSGTRSPEGEAK